VVVAIVATLVSILMPSLSGARASARTSACVLSIRQLTVSLDSYANDFKGRYAPGAPDFLANRTRWFGSRATGTGVFNAEGGSLSAYLGDGSNTARICPEFSRTIASLASRNKGFERGCGGYGYNNAYLGTTRDARGLVVTDRAGASLIIAPAQTIAFADAALAESELIEYAFIEPRVRPDDATQRPDPSTHFRHGKGPSSLANLAMADGHVRSASRTFTWSSGIYSSSPADLMIGWAGDADDNRLYSGSGLP
jgi:prepilin-type processing-associated H-X9-DG protein